MDQEQPNPEQPKPAEQILPDKSTELVPVSETITKPRTARKSHSKEEIYERRRQEYDLLLLGESYKNIAKQFGLSQRVVELDIAKMREEGAKKIKLNDTLGKIYDYDEKSRRRSKYFWGVIIDKTTTHDEKIKAARELRHEDIEAVKREQMAGILPKEISPLVSIESISDKGTAENRVQINIIAPVPKKQEEEPKDDN